MEEGGDLTAPSVDDTGSESMDGSPSSRSVRSVVAVTSSTVALSSEGSDELSLP